MVTKKPGEETQGPLIENYCNYVFRHYHCKGMSTDCPQLELVIEPNRPTPASSFSLFAYFKCTNECFPKLQGTGAARM
jgi:hypothetical protein